MMQLRQGVVVLAVVVAVFLVSLSAAAVHKPVYGRYAGWVPSASAAARAEDLHRVRFYLTPSNVDRLYVRIILNR
jgi:hypothetical protein